jgi:DNA-binding transcriptional regulator LsrR (DeoR family)
VLTDKKPKCHCQLLSEEKLDIRTWLEYSPHTSLKHLAEEMGISKETIRTATKLLKLQH